MYREHVPVLDAGMRSDPAVFARGVTFAFLSARVQFVRVRDAMSQVDAVGQTAQALWGWKRGAYLHLRKHRNVLFDRVSATTDPEKGISILTEIPGMGIVKSAFVLQMMGFDIACLDARNIVRLGLNPREYRTDGEGRKKGPAFKRKITRYVRETDGSAETMWNAWCTDVAQTYHVSAEEISRDHLIIVPLSVRRTLALRNDYPRFSLTRIGETFNDIPAQSRAA